MATWTEEVFCDERQRKLCQRKRGDDQRESDGEISKERGTMNGLSRVQRASDKLSCDI